MRVDGVLAVMDQQNSMRWTEALKAEKRSKLRWMEKYLTPQEMQREQEEEAAAISELSSTKSEIRKGRSERDMMELRLANVDDSIAEKAPAPLPKYELMRRQVAAEVASVRQRSHRYTGDLSTESMLKDIGPALWISVNPQYAPTKAASTTHLAHIYHKNAGWGARVDKTHHLKQDEFMQHAEKSLQLGEKVFISGGMKLGGK